MREILFRGRDHAGKWHKGSATSRIEEDPATTMLYVAYYIQDYGLSGEEHEVDPETVVPLVFEATEHHPEIWEGDIIEDEDGCRMVVAFTYYNQTRYVITHSKTRVGYVSLDENYLRFKFKYRKAKVVGNIHDNPELITEPFS